MKKIVISIAALLVFGSSMAQEKKESKYSVEKVQKVNAELYQLVFNPTDQKVYVAGPRTGAGREGDNFIYALDGKTLAVVDSINVGKNVPYGIALNNKTQTVYAGNSRQNSVTAIDLKTKTVKVIGNGKEKSKIREIAVDEARNEIYVSDHGNPGVWIIDGKTNTYTGDISFEKGYLLGLAVDSQRGKIYQTDADTMEGYVNVYDSKTRKLEKKFKTWSYCPINIAIDHKSNRIFVSQSNDNNVTVLDGKTGEIINKVYLGYDSSPIGLVYDEKNNVVYTANRSKKEVAVVDAATFEVIERIPTEGLPNTISHDAGTGAVYVTNKKAGRNGEPVPNGNTVVKIVRK